MTLLVVTGGLYLAGLVSAVVLARPILDKDARNAVLMIGFKTCDAPGSNRFVVLVPLMLLGVVAVFVTILLLRVFAFPEIDDPPQPEPIRSPYPEVNGALLGRNWGEYVSEQDCSFLARQHRSNCGDDPMCLEENGVAIDECIKTVRARERNEAD